MANRLHAAVALLILLFSSNHSANIKPAYTEMQMMKGLGEETLKCLEEAASGALRSHTGSHTVECIREPKKHELLNCSITCTFSSYLKNASELNGLKSYEKLHGKLSDIRQRVEDLNMNICERICGTHPAAVCVPAFQDNKMTSTNLKKLRSILVLFSKWFSRPME